jgi:hypothetical protein
MAGRSSARRRALAAIRNGAAVAGDEGQMSIASDSEKDKRTDQVSEEIQHCKADLGGGGLPILPRQGVSKATDEEDRERPASSPSVRLGLTPPSGGGRI